MRQLLMFVAALAAFAFPSSAQSNGAWEVIHDWGSLPGGLEWGPASQVSASPDGRIIVFRREAPTFVILDADGNLLNSWGDGLFTLAHGIRVDRDGFVWVTDNADNIVQKYTIDGELLLTLGQKGVAGDNASRDAFDGPADVFVDDDGSVYVADGYRNSRIVQFSADGTFIRAIGGTSGDGPGEFDLPHSVVVDSEGRIIVADAGNSRMQVFDNEGNFVEEWTDFPSTPRGAVDIDADDTLYISHVDSEAVTIMRDGEVLEVVYGLEGRPHGVTVDNDGNIYVANTGNRMVKKVVRRR